MKSLIIVFILLATSLYGQDAREIINRYLDTVSNGNVDNWNKIKSTYIESEVCYSQQNFEQKVSFLKPDKPSFHKSYRVPPYNHKIEIYEDSAFTRLLSSFYYLKNRTIILLGNIPPMIKEPAPRDEFFSDHLPVQISKLVDKSKSIELLGIKQFPIEGLQCYEIKITTKGRNYVLYINTDTFLLEYWNGREDEDMSILAKFYNYKKVDGFLLPMSDCLMRNGVVYFWKNIKQIEINADIDPQLFNYDDK